jgi:hypothetical protein
LACFKKKSQPRSVSIALFVWGASATCYGRYEPSNVGITARSFPMTTSIRVDANVVTLINVMTVEPVNHPHLLALLRDNTENTISKLEGWIATHLIASRDKRRVVIYSQWKALANVEAMRVDPRMVAYFPRLAALASFDSIVGDVVLSHTR